MEPVESTILHRIADRTAVGTLRGALCHYTRRLHLPDPIIHRRWAHVHNYGRQHLCSSALGGDKFGRWYGGR